MTTMPKQFDSHNPRHLTIATFAISLPISIGILMLVVGGWKVLLDYSVFVGQILLGLGIVFGARVYAAKRNQSLSAENADLRKRLQAAADDFLTLRRGNAVTFHHVQHLAKDFGVEGESLTDWIVGIAQKRREYERLVVDSHIVITELQKNEQSYEQEVAELREEITRLRNRPPAIVKEEMSLSAYIGAGRAQVVNASDWLSSRKKGSDGANRRPQPMPETWQKNVAAGCRAQGIVWLKLSNPNELLPSPTAETVSISEFTPDSTDSTG